MHTSITTRFALRQLPAIWSSCARPGNPAIWSGCLLLGLLILSVSGLAQRGNVFRDYNADGARQTTEPLIAGVVVQAFDAANTPCASATTTTSADGSGNNYTLSGCSGSIRVEFSIPSIAAQACGLDSQFDFSAYGGTSYGSSVQFTTAAGTANFAVGNPHQYASPTLVNPKIFTSCYVSGNNLGTGNVGDADAFISVNYNPTGNKTPAPAHYANTRQIGSTWGVGYSKQAKRVFTAAVLKRHTGLGPLGSGGIYMLDPSKQLPDLTGVTQFLDFDAIGIPTRGTGTYSGTSVAGPVVPFSGVVGTNAERGLALNKDIADKDAQALAQAGRVSFGDLDLSDDGRYLYVMNLYDRKLYEIDLTDAANPVAPTLANKATKIRSWAIPEPCDATKGVARPWGIDFYRGKPYVGVVCDASASQLKADLNFTVYELAPSTGMFTAKFSNTLNFPRGISDGFRPNGAARAGWFGWTDDWSKLTQTGETALNYPQPILSDIEFDTDGSMVLGFIDRMGLQGGWFNYGPITGNTTLYFTISGGDLLRAYKRPDCNWELESAGKEGPSSPKAATGGATNNQGPGNGEFYYEETFGDKHQETALGGLGILFGSGDVVSTVFDPFGYDSFGLGWFSNTTGKRTKGFEIYATGNSGSPSPSGTFSKGLTLGDVEIQNELPPLEIGNRVWKDADKDGLQDANEAGIDGLTVQLFKGSTKVGETTTSNGGQYYFNSSNVNLGGATEVEPNTAYTIKLANTLNSGLLAGLLAYSPQNPALAGSDADATGVVSVSTGNYGENAHTYDIGLTNAPPCSLTTSVTSTSCNPATNQYSSTVSVTLTNPVAGTITLTDGPRSLTLAVTASTTGVTGTFNNITSDGTTHLVSASLTGCGSATATYTAPVSCSVAPCGQSLAITPGLCQTATNTYSLSGTITVINLPTGTYSVSSTAFATLTPTLNPMFGDEYDFTVNDLVSNGQTYTVTATFSNTACAPVSKTFTAPASCSAVPGTPNYALAKSVDLGRVAQGGIVTYTVSLTNTGTATATNVVVTDQLSSTAVTLMGSATVSSGAFVPSAGGGSWTIASLSVGQVATLTLKAKLNQEGIIYNTATASNGQTATVCTTVPFRVCANETFDFLLSVPAGRTSYQWRRNGIDIAGATTNTLSVTALGEYTVSTVSSASCPDGSCCPFVVEAYGPLPSLTAVGVAATCTGQTPQSNAAITLVGSNSAAVSYNITKGSSFTASTPLFTTPQNLSAVAGGVLIGGQPNPAVAQDYTIRVYSADGCFADTVVTLQPTVCGCPPPACIPFVVKKTKAQGKLIAP